MIPTDDDTFWFMKPKEEIQKMIDNLPPQETPQADSLLAALAKARENDCENRFLQSLLDYMMLGMKFDLALTTSIEDWEL